MNRKIALIVIASVVLSLYAQLPMGGWRTHFAYSNVYQIAATGDKVYGTSEGALFSVDISDQSMEDYSVLSGLNGASVYRIASDKATGNLFIAYENGNIDIMDSDGNITNIPDLYNKQIPFNKQVHHITIDGHNAYLSTDFGVVVVNLMRNEIAETYYISSEGLETKVYATAIVGDSIYAATDEGIRVAAVKGSNLMNYEVWHTADSLTTAGEVLHIECSNLINYKEQLYAIIGGHLFKRTADNLWQPYLPHYGIYNFTAVDNKLLLTTNNIFFVLSEDGENFTDITVGDNISVQDITLIHGLYWSACGEYGIVSFNPADQTHSSYVPSGPATNTSFRLKFAGEKLFSFPGGRRGTQFYRPGAVMMFENETWTNIRMQEIFDVTQKPVTDFMDVGVDPADNSHFLVTSYGTGAYEFRDNKFYKHYSTEGTPLVSAVPSNVDRYLRLDGGMSDSEGNFWFLNVHTPRAIQILKTDGSWATLTRNIFDINTIVAGLMRHSQHPELMVFVSALGHTGIVFWYDNGTPFDDSDDTVKFIRQPVDQDGNELNDLDFYCNPVEDLNGDIWVGTSSGVLVFPNPIQAITETDYHCRRVKIARNDGTNLADYLLDNEQVNAIVVDGANRKWIGTEKSGAYLVSESGQETVKHFTTNDSPLLSDNVMSIAINPVNGEVFFGTGNGLISYMSDATAPHDDYDDIRAYPNPVRENFGGVITITGLMSGSTVKIANMAGEVVCDTQSNGGTAVWDGRTKQGRKVSAGIYWIIAFNEDGSERGRTKILVIK